MIYYLITQVGPKTACETGTLSSTWPSPAWPWCVLSGGPMRLEVFWQVMSLCGFRSICWAKAGLRSNSLFLTGLISEVELGAQSVVYQLAGFAYMVIFLMANVFIFSQYWTYRPSQRFGHTFLFIASFLLLLLSTL